MKPVETLVKRIEQRREGLQLDTAKAVENLHKPIPGLSALRPRVSEVSDEVSRMRRDRGERLTSFFPTNRSTEKALKKNIAEGKVRSRIVKDVLNNEVKIYEPVRPSTATRP